MRRQGMSLIEILVVLLVLGILAALLFPVFASARETSRATVCLSNVRQLAIGFRLYLDAWEDVYPGCGWGLRPTPSDWVAVGGYYRISVTRGSLYPMVGNPLVYRCPSDSLASIRGLSYSMNRLLDYLSERTLRQPAQTVLLCEEDNDSAGGAGLGINDAVYDSGNGLDRIARRHHGSGFALYCDGHVKKVWPDQADSRSGEAIVEAFVP